MLAGLTLPAEAYVVSGDNPAYLGSMNSVDSRDVSWTVIFTQAGTFALDVNASGYYYYSGYVYAHTSMNIEVSEREKHDVAVWLENPLFFEIGKSTLLNATAYNLGLKDESYVELQLLINDNVANSTTVTQLLAGSSYTMHHTWTPTLEDVYNITAYVPPLPGETSTMNNVKSTILNPLPDIVIVADDDAAASAGRGTSLPDFELALNEAGLDYFVWKESSMGNPSLAFLLNFAVVIWTCGDYYSRAVDPTDAETLRTYFAQGGTILLEGENIGSDHDSDTFMISVAHATYQVDRVGAPGLTVIEPAHPVTTSLPASFNWIMNPFYADGVAPANGGIEVLRYTGFSWAAVIAFNGTETGKGSAIYYAFPLYCLAQPQRDKLVKNSVSWLLTLSARTLRGDITGTNDRSDGKVDMYDLRFLGKAYGTEQGESSWDEYKIADINGPNGVPDEVIDNYDLAVINENYGRTKSQ